MSNVKEIPFKISARTARLIGRQNFPNAEGAVIELVKNSYDADAKTCIIVFDNRYTKTPEKLLPAEYNDFVKKEKLISKYYSLDAVRGEYIFKEVGSKAVTEQEKIRLEKHLLQDFFRLQTKLYVIDNGEGMTNQIIEDYWMTIGTNNKEVDIFTTSKRIKTGEKGIGRFALDKLGDSTEMLTKPNPQVHSSKDRDNAFLWLVDWNDFEGDSKTLNQVKADLIDIPIAKFSEEVAKVLPLEAKQNPDLDVEAFQTGTRIEISNLRDVWDDALVSKLYANLEVLIPPREERTFEVFLFSALEPNKFGKVSPSVCDDFDYKVDAHVDADGIAQIIIHRNEFDVAKFPKELFDREDMKVKNYTKTAFEQGEIIERIGIEQLAPGLKDIDDKDILANIGEFDVVFYFMKAQAAESDREVFLYKEFKSASRKAWLDRFGGIKLFRDNFRVRPYGEVKNAAFDWLQLGERASRTPCYTERCRFLSA